MQHEHVNERTVALSVRGSKITGRLLAQAMQAFLKKSRAPAYKHGKQSVKSLTKDGSSLANIEVSGDGIGSFKKVARKYNVDFALKKDKSVEPPNWIVFFKAKDNKALESAFNEYSKITLTKTAGKPSLLKRIERFKELAKSLMPPVKHRERGGREL